MRELAVYLLRVALSVGVGWYLLLLPLAAALEALGSGGWLSVHGGGLFVLMWPCFAVAFWVLGFIPWLRTGRRHSTPQSPKQG